MFMRLWSGHRYLVGESWHTAVQHKLQGPEMYWQLHLEDQLPLLAFRYLQKQTTANINETRIFKVIILCH